MASLAEPLRRRYHKTHIYSKRTRTKGRRRRSIAMRQVNDDGNLSYIIMTFTYIVFGCSVIPYRSFSPLASIVSTLFSDRLNCPQRCHGAAPGPTKTSYEGQAHL